jgi:hypothetical protein
VRIKSKRHKVSPENILADDLVLLVKCMSVRGSDVKALNNKINIWLASSLVEYLPPTAWAMFDPRRNMFVSGVLAGIERTQVKFLHNPIQKSEHVINRLYCLI